MPYPAKRGSVEAIWPLPPALGERNEIKKNMEEEKRKGYPVVHECTVKKKRKRERNEKRKKMKGKKRKKTANGCPRLYMIAQASALRRDRQENRRY